AGITLPLVSALFSTYLPLSFAQVPIALFGLGAILIVHNPRGIVALHADQAASLLAQASRIPLPGRRPSARTGPQEVGATRTPDTPEPATGTAAHAAKVVR
ncbi:MAG TPA: hypothetical protein VK816_09275, partial [Jatrophihabitantaceae bacterium]|nr:hypothetical protein [Jatrophihabitantaceae bacterium]